jgi:hypothetical protein
MSSFAGPTLSLHRYFVHFGLFSYLNDLRMALVFFFLLLLCLLLCLHSHLSHLSLFNDLIHIFIFFFASKSLYKYIENGLLHFVSLKIHIFEHFLKLWKFFLCFWLCLNVDLCEMSLLFNFNKRNGLVDLLKLSDFVFESLNFIFELSYFIRLISAIIIVLGTYGNPHILLIITFFFFLFNVLCLILSQNFI